MNDDKQLRHPPEAAVFMNMCMVCEGDKVLALDKTGDAYHGTTFPGRVLQIMDNNDITECFMDVKDDGTVVEHMF